MLHDRNPDVILTSHYSAIIYSGMKHGVFAKCNNYEAERILSPGSFSISLGDASRCTFQSQFYLFTRHNHGNNIDMMVN